MTNRNRDEYQDTGKRYQDSKKKYKFGSNNVIMEVQKVFTLGSRMK